MTDHSDPAVGTRDTNVPWYNETLDNLSDGARQLLETYSKIPAEDVVPHIYRVRSQAWSIFPYPCIGGFRFLDLSIGKHPLYPEILSRLKSSSSPSTSSSSSPSSSSSEPTYLDLGCCFGQDLRRLVADGVPSQRLYGSDLQLPFMELGYELFRDRETLRAHFIAADVFDPESELRQLDGRVDVLHAASFFHLFTLEDQIKVAKRVVRLLKPEKGSLLVGRQVGNVEGREFEHRTNKEGKMFRHNEETWRKMWEDVGAETGTAWEVECELVEWDYGGPKGWNAEGTRRLIFSVRRL